MNRDGDGGATAEPVWTWCTWSLGAGRELADSSSAYWASWEADRLSLAEAGGSRFRCAGIEVPVCAATGAMRLTLSLGLSTPGRGWVGLGRRDLQLEPAIESALAIEFAGMRGAWWLGEE